MTWLPYTVVTFHPNKASFQYADKEAAESFAQDIAQQFTDDTKIVTYRAFSNGLPRWHSDCSDRVISEVMHSATYE